MSTFYLVLVVLVVSFVGFWAGRSRAFTVSGGAPHKLHSRPNFYGMYVALLGLVPALLAMAFFNVGYKMLYVWNQVEASLPTDLRTLPADELKATLRSIENLAKDPLSGADDPAVVSAAEYLVELQAFGANVVTVLVLAVLIFSMGFAWMRISPTMRARNAVEKILKIFLIVCSMIAILTTVGIVFSLIRETWAFFDAVAWHEFLFGIHWSPQTALRADQVASAGSFGAIPLVVGTLLITLIAILVAVPVGLLSAVYLSDYASDRVRAFVKPVLEILAGIPTVVYGFFAALTVAPFIRDLGGGIGLDIASESALAAGMVMGIMIIPFVSSLSDDVINSVPQSLREGAFGLGATKAECIKQVVLPAALPGVFAAVLLAVSRAIGETMIVVMAAGLKANLTFNPLEAVTTVTVQIVTLLKGDQEFDSAKTLSAFALGFLLFTATLIMNIIALRVVRKYREKYE